MNRKIVLVSRPTALPKDSDFALVSEQLTAVLKQGEVLVKVEWLSIDPAQRIWISGARSYMDKIALNSVVTGLGVGVVVYSQSPMFRKGHLVSGFLHWQEFAIVKAQTLTKLPKFENPRSYLGVLGLNGLTAYFAVLDIAKPSARETMVVSTAAGAVGSVACQLGKMKGCKVIGITGTEAKKQWLLEELKLDGAVNYKDSTQLAKDIRNLCPEGVDIYIDHVGGEVLDAVLLNIRKYARIVLCGAISSYNLKRAPPIHFYPLVISNSAAIEGFIVWDFKNRFELAGRYLSKWVKEKKIKYREHIIEGLENAPQALRMLLTGENVGKTIVKVIHNHPSL